MRFLKTAKVRIIKRGDCYRLQYKSRIWHLFWIPVEEGDLSDRAYGHYIYITDRLEKAKAVRDKLYDKLYRETLGWEVVETTTEKTYRFKKTLDGK